MKKKTNPISVLGKELFVKLSKIAVILFIALPSCGENNNDEKEHDIFENIGPITLEMTDFESQEDFNAFYDPSNLKLPPLTYTHHFENCPFTIVLPEKVNTEQIEIEEEKDEISYYIITNEEIEVGQYYPFISIDAKCLSRDIKPEVIKMKDTLTGTFAELGAYNLVVRIIENDDEKHNKYESISFASMINYNGNTYQNNASVNIRKHYVLNIFLNYSAVVNNPHFIKELLQGVSFSEN